ncbi:glucoamylase family protein [Hephaestia mangrovi]|uniref:glucoamylase family protein n=1 Tax=Hephaestia mangrovi TaxID=2873268 RepID=UPI001CA6C9C6|nr:glucoamylase family protein [Hephaestia mangrovi]MBY8828400.1 Tat pathway signal protein [Hephaestia mangrovi]
MLDRRAFVGRSALALAGLASGCASGSKPGTIAAAADETPPIDDLQHRTFQYFWDTSNPKNGLAPDRWPTKSFASIAAVGFALTAYPIGVVHGWISRDQARQRTLATLDFFANAKQGPEPTGTSGYKGFFYHFLDMETGERFDQTELSTIDTTLLLGGVLFAQSWFDTDHPDEVRIRALADRIYAAVDWTWIRPRYPFISMGWHPESGFISSAWSQFNEALLLYVLALGSPTYPIQAGTQEEWTSRFQPQWGGQYGEPHLIFPALFVYQYSNLWLDFRGLQDQFTRAHGIDYFENSRRATYAQRDYAIANPKGWVGYGPDIWGLTACDGPGQITRQFGGIARSFTGYSARGPGADGVDDGTIAPTAAAGSIAFAPDIVLPAIGAMHARYGSAIYGKYGFLDSFNPTLSTGPATPKGRIVEGLCWVDDDYLGIDQGPIVGGIENWRSGMIWSTMRRNPHIRRGLIRAGFSGGWLSQ